MFTLYRVTVIKQGEIIDQLICENESQAKKLQSQLQRQYLFKSPQTHYPTTKDREDRENCILVTRDYTGINGEDKL